MWGRRRARGTVATKVHEQHGLCCILSAADCDVLEQLARSKDKYQRLPYYASCFGVSKSTISLELTSWRVQDGKKPINVVKI